MKLQITFCTEFRAMCLLQGATEKILKLAPGSYLVHCFSTGNHYTFKSDTFYFSVDKKKWDSQEFQNDNQLSVLELK